MVVERTTTSYFCMQGTLREFKGWNEFLSLASVHFTFHAFEIPKRCSSNWSQSCLLYGWSLQNASLTEVQHSSWKTFCTSLEVWMCLLEEGIIGARFELVFSNKKMYLPCPPPELWNCKCYYSLNHFLIRIWPKVFPSSNREQNYLNGKWIDLSF